ncbi:MAG: hypothetical protein FJ270_08180 [Planctomycetes bacterium]|nr:hypothetical protein [Planctomycetota bacterium]
MLPEVALYLLTVLLLPALAGVAVGGFGVVMVARCAEADRARAVRCAQVGQALAAPIAFMASFLLETGPVGLPPVERWHVLPYAVGAAAIVGAIVSGMRSAWWVQWSIVAAILGGLAWKFVVFPASNPYLQAGLLGSIVLVGLLWSAVARDACSVGMAMMAAIVFAGLGVLMVLANFASLGVMAFAVAAALAGLGMVSGVLNLREAARLRAAASVQPSAVDAQSVGETCPAEAVCELVPWTAAAATALAAIACVLALCGHAYNYGEVRPLHWAAILLSPFFALLICRPCLRGVKPIVGVAWRAGLCLVVVLATIINAAGHDDDADGGSGAAGSDPMMDMLEESK